MSQILCCIVNENFDENAQGKNSFSVYKSWLYHGWSGSEERDALSFSKKKKKQNFNVLPIKLKIANDPIKIGQQEPEISNFKNYRIP